MRAPRRETLTCTPVSAGGRWLGVIFADRGGSRFELTDEERHAMWTLGKTAALAASVRIATSQQGRARLLEARIDLAREIHERVVQRLFGVSLVLGSEHGLSEEARRAAPTRCRPRSPTCATRSSRPLAPPSSTPARLCATSSRGSAATTRTCRSSSTGRRASRCRRRSSRSPSRCSRRRSATPTSTPTRRRARARRPYDGTFVLEVRNDGARPAHARHRHGPAARGGRGAPARRARGVRPRGRGGLARAARRPVGEDERNEPRAQPARAVVDDHDVVHWGFRLLLAEQPWVERCLGASSVEEALSWRAATSRTWRSSTCSSARSRAPSCARRCGAPRRTRACS